MRVRVHGGFETLNRDLVAFVPTERLDPVTALHHANGDEVATDWYK